MRHDGFYFVTVVSTHNGMDYIKVSQHSYQAAGSVANITGYLRKNPCFGCPDNLLLHIGVKKAVE
jgi:hypothetical protein